MNEIHMNKIIRHLNISHLLVIISHYFNISVFCVSPQKEVDRVTLAVWCLNPTHNPTLLHTSCLCVCAYVCER